MRRFSQSKPESKGLGINGLVELFVAVDDIWQVVCAIEHQYLLNSDVRLDRWQSSPKKLMIPPDPAINYQLITT